MPDRTDVQVGIDAIELRRCLRLDRRRSPALANRVLGPGERAWCVGDPVRLGACLAVKESAIKAHGGRWEGFRWSDVMFEPASGPASDEAAGLAAALAGSGVAVGGHGRCRVGPSAARGPVVWGRAGSDVVAAVLLRFPAGGGR